MGASRHSNTLVGTTWMLVGCACVIAMQTMARHVAQDLPAIEMVFFRFLFGMMFMSPWLVRTGLSGLRTCRWRLYLVRATGTLVIMTCLYTALSVMPVADVTALLFTAPIFTTLGAGLFLGERVGVRRWVAVGVGLGGTLVILRPGMDAFSFMAVLVLIGAFVNAVVLLITKVLSRTETANAIVFYQSLMASALALPFALWFWVSPTYTSLAWLMAMGGVATVGQQCITRALMVADASAIQPANFSRLLFAALFGYFAFGESPDAWIWLGGVIVFAATFLAASEKRQANDAQR